MYSRSKILKFYLGFYSLNRTFAAMNSKLMKMDAPYNVIYAGGKVGLHMATLMVWNDDEEAPDGITDAASYPVIDEGEEYPAGTLIDFAELHDCRVLCPYSEKQGCPATNLFWLAKIIEYDFQQLEPAGPEYILERMKLLRCEIAMPTKKVMEKNEDTGEQEEVELTVYDFEATLDSWCKSGFGKPGSVYRVRSNRYEGFYFESEGTTKEIYHDLSYQLSVYRGYLNDLISVRFSSDDLYLLKLTNRLNADQCIEGFEHEDDYSDWD